MFNGAVFLASDVDFIIEYPLWFIVLRWFIWIGGGLAILYFGGRFVRKRFSNHFVKPS